MCTRGQWQAGIVLPGSVLSHEVFYPAALQVCSLIWISEAPADLLDGWKLARDLSPSKIQFQSVVQVSCSVAAVLGTACSVLNIVIFLF